MKKIVLVVTLGLCMTANLMAQVPNYVPTNSLVGWWPFNGNANDESGNGNDGTVGGATLSSDRFSNPNSSYFFSGMSTNITINNTFFNNGWLGYSISFWFNPNSNQYNGCIVNTIPHDGLGIAYSYYGTNKKIYHSKNSNTSVHAWDILNADPLNYAAFEFNTWYHIVVIKSSNTYLYYVNGSLDKTINTAISPLNDMCKLVFGNMDPSVGFQPVIGSLDDFGIWNRALTECEIQDLYHAQLGSQSIYAGADQTICKGENVILSASGGSNYQWDNNVVDGQAFTPNQTNNYSVTGTDTLGCTGTDTVLVTVLENSSSTLNETALDSYTLNGQTYTQSGTYTQTIPSVNGCDSIITLNLTLNFTGIAVEETLPLVIYPNPATKQITIDNGNFSSMAGYSIKIENNAGQQVFQSAINQAQFNIDLSTWTGNGLYFVHLIDPQNNTVTVRKIVLE
jgi:hypothetical protein